MDNNVILTTILERLTWVEENQVQRFDDLDKRFNSLGEKVDTLSTNASAAVTSLSNQIKHMDEKLGENIVMKYEYDFVSEKIQYLEKEIFKLKQQ